MRRLILNLFLSLGHAIGAAGIYLSWDKNQDKEITKDEVSNFFLVTCNCELYECYEVIPDTYRVSRLYCTCSTGEGEMAFLWLSS